MKKSKYLAAKAQLIIVLGLSICVTLAFGDAGTAGFSILKKPNTARARSIASSVNANNDSSSLLYNSAMLKFSQKREMILISESGFAQDRMGGVILSIPAFKFLVSAGVFYYDAGTIELNWIEEDRIVTQNASAEKDILGLISCSIPLSNRVCFGVSAKHAQMELVEREKGQAYAFDAGMQVMIGKNYSFSVAVQNIGNSAGFINQESPMPVIAYSSLGYSAYSANLGITVAAGAEYDKAAETTTPEVGAEISAGPIFLNSGYRFIENEMNMQAGIGVKFNNFRLAYGYIPSTFLDPVQRMSMSFSF